MKKMFQFIVVIALLGSASFIVAEDSFPKPLCLDGTCVYVNPKGEPVFGGKIFYYAHHFSQNGLAAVRVEQFSNKYGFINTKGEAATPFTLDASLGMYDFAPNGLAKIKFENRYGYISKDSFVTGKLAMKVTFDEASDFAPNGLALVKKIDKYGYINAQGEMVIPATYRSAYPFAANGLAVVVTNDSKYGYINSKGEMVIPAKFDHAADFGSNGLAAVQVRTYESKYGFINTKGEMVIPAKFDTAEMFTSNGLARVGIDTVGDGDKRDYLYGYVNDQGKLIIPVSFKYAGHFKSNGFAEVEVNNKWVFINAKGEIVTQEKFNDIFKFYPNIENGLYEIKRNGKVILIDATGKEYSSKAYEILKKAVNKK